MYDMNGNDMRLPIFGTGAISAEHLAALARVYATRFPDQKITAIKELRAVVQVGLKEAKDLIEANFAPKIDPVLAMARQIKGLQA